MRPGEELFLFDRFLEFLHKVRRLALWAQFAGLLLGCLLLVECKLEDQLHGVVVDAPVDALTYVLVFLGATLSLGFLLFLDGFIPVGRFLFGCFFRFGLGGLFLDGSGFLFGGFFLGGGLGRFFGSFLGHFALVSFEVVRTDSSGDDEPARRHEPRPSGRQFSDFAAF